MFGFRHERRGHRGRGPACEMRRSMMMHMMDRCGGNEHERGFFDEHPFGPEFMMHMMARHDDRFGGGRFGDDFSGHHRRPPFLRGRKFGADELQLILLVLLKAQASYGYELIKRLDEKSGGFYKPSPGVIYPALTWLEDVGYVTVQHEGSRKRYALAEEGAQYLADNQSLADALFERLAAFARQMDSVNQAMREEHQPFIPQLMTMINDLRMELHGHHHSSEEVQRQAADILGEALQALKKLPR